MTQPEKLDLTSHNADKSAELLRLFPEIRTESGQIDFDKLKLALGQTVDVGRERYGMTWPGKAECFKTIQTPSMGTLLPVPAESVDFDTTENLIIEGDNLEALKLLQKAYLGKVKMIYIDPPYNTGNDFIYPDNYTESLQTYLEYTKQVDAEGRKFGTNSDTDGRFHSRWLNMMYPRLYLARNLLRDDGVIYISIDDNEVDNLRKICDDVFGEENFIVRFVWQKGAGTQNDNNYVAVSHEFILCYAKSKDNCTFYKLPPTKEMLTTYDLSDEFEAERGKYYLRNLNDFSIGDRPGLHYDIVCPDGKVLNGKEHRWRCDDHRFKWRVENSRIVFNKNSDGEWEVMYKQYLNETKEEVIKDKNGRILSRGKIPESLLIKLASTGAGSKDLKELGMKDDFSYPKPIDLIQHFLTISTIGDDIVLDFFAGSGTTAHAVLGINKQDNGNRKFILTQLPEPLENKKYSTISEVTKERVRRVIKQVKSEKEGQLDLQDKQDLGFRVFKLAESNFKAWDASAPKDTKSLAKQLELHVEHIREGRSSEDILYEILFKSGYPLTVPIQKHKIEKKTVYGIQDNAMLICLDKKLTLELIRAMAELKPQRIVCLDLGFAGNDQLKTNAVQIFKNKEIVFKTV